MTGGHVYHEIPGTPFAVWEAPKASRGPRFTVIEPGVGRRGMGRQRGAARTLAEAVTLAGGLRPSTAAEILAGITPFDDLDRKRLATLLSLGTPGTPLWVYCDGGGYEAISDGLAVSAVEALFGQDDLDCWLVRWRDPAGEEVKGLFCVPFEDAERAWWVISDGGRVIAGGPPIFDADRARELAAELGGRVVRGTRFLARKVT